MGKQTYIIGFLVLVVLSASFYIFLPEKVRVDVTATDTKYSVWEDSKWVLGATEVVLLWEGATKMRAKSRELNWKDDGGIITFNRTVYWKNNIVTYEYIIFDSSINNVELVPIKHTVSGINWAGKILAFEYKDILYGGETKEINSPFSFGHKMKLEWQEGAYYSKVFQNKLSSDKIIIKYKPQQDYQIFSVRLFDPADPAITVFSPLNQTYAAGTTSIDFNISTIFSNISLYATSCLYQLDDMQNRTMNVSAIGRYNYSGINVLTSGDGLAGSFCMGKNNTHLFVCDPGDDLIYVYYTNLTYAGWTINVDLGGDSTPTPSGVEWNASNIMVAETDADVVMVFDTSGNYAGRNWSLNPGGGQNNNPRGLVYDGVFWWSINANNNFLYKYDNAHSVVNSSSIDSGVVNISGVSYQGVDMVDGYVRAYTTTDIAVLVYDNKTYSQIKYDIDIPTTTLSGGAVGNGTSIWATSSGTDRIYRFDVMPWNYNFTGANTSMTTGHHETQFWCTTDQGVVNTSDRALFNIDVAAEAGTICGDINTSTTLTGNLANKTTCFNITVNSVTLDGAGYTIASNGTGFGIIVSNRNNITIKNFANIYNFTIGINVTNSSNVSIQNNSVQSNDLNLEFGDYHAIQLTNTTRVNITSNNITTHSPHGYPIYLIDSDYNKLSDNILLSTLRKTWNIYLVSDSNYNNITNNIIRVKGPFSEVVGIGIALALNSNSNNISYNNITINETGYGLYISSSSHNLFFANNFNVTGQQSAGLVMDVNSDNNTFYFNNFTTTNTDSVGIEVSYTSQSNLFENNKIFTKENGSVGIRFLHSAKNNIFLNNNITTNVGPTILTLNSSSNNTIIYNNTFGQINWTKGNLTTNISLRLGETIFLENNNTGVIDSGANNQELNGTANIQIRQLTFTFTPRLYKNGIRCDNTDNCNITYNPNGGVITANISSFSNHSGRYALPIINNLVLNTTNISSNSTDVNLTLYINLSSEQGINVKNMTSWYVNNVPMMSLYNTFERINETNSSNLRDYSNNGNNATDYNSAVWNATGGFDGRGAYQFNGANQQINFSSSTSLDLTGDYSICAWFKLPAVAITPSPYTMISRYSDGANRGFALRMAKNGSKGIIQYFHVSRGSSEGGLLFNGVESTTSVNDSKYYHTCITFDTVNGSIVYVNGVKENFDARNKTAISTYTQTFMYGAQQATTPRFFNGTLDDVMIFNRSLHPEQVQTLFLNKTTIMTYRETNVGENWQACVIPNEGNEDSPRVCSNTVTIIGASCLYDSGNWDVDCADMCRITSNKDLGGKNFTLTGTGEFILDGGRITNYQIKRVVGTDASNRCNLYEKGGGGFG